MDLTECKHVPHPNALRIAYEERDLTEGEKETFAEAHVKNMRADAMKVMKICSVVLVVAALVLCVWCFGMCRYICIPLFGFTAWKEEFKTSGKI